MTINELTEALWAMGNDRNLSDRASKAAAIASRTIKALCDSVGPPLDMESEASDLPRIARQVTPFKALLEELSDKG